jgi:tetratricopeptide (TPR) repeat protein
MRLASAFVVLLLSSHALADVRRDQQARDAYRAGAAAYEAGDYQGAYERFKESFQLSHEPALLYNIASALQGLKRPHDAAESLRSFLRVQPNDPDRPKIEQRIATLEEEQHMIDADRARDEARHPRSSEPMPPPVVVTPPPPAAALATPTLIATPPPEPSAAERRHRRTVIAASVTTGAVVLVAGAVVLGVLLSDQKTPPYTMTSLGAHPGTR